MTDYIFKAYPFRKLYGEGLASNMAGADWAPYGVGRYVEEGRLRDHTFTDGRYEDFVIMATYRDTWRMPDFRNESLAARMRQASEQSDER